MSRRECALVPFEAERGERLGALEVAEQLGQLDAQVGLVVLLAADRVADDHRDVVGVDVPVGPAGVDERRPGGADRPTLAVVHLIGDLRRNGSFQRIGSHG